MNANETRASWRNYRYIAARFPRRFTLRLLLAGVTLLCIALGIWTHRAREQRRIVELIQSSGGTVWYDYEFNGLTPYPNSRAPEFLVVWLGEDFFHEITLVETSDSKVIHELPRFRHLLELRLYNPSITDDDLASISDLKSLRALDIAGRGGATAELTQIGDKSLERIAHLSKLYTVQVLGSRITSRGIEFIARLPSLQVLNLGCLDSGIDDRTAENLRSRHIAFRIFRCAPNGSTTSVSEYGLGP